MIRNARPAGPFLTDPQYFTPFPQSTAPGSLSP